jgi:hypothetical protein
MRSQWAAQYFKLLQSDGYQLNFFFNRVRLPLRLRTHSSILLNMVSLAQVGAPMATLHIQQFCMCRCVRRP